MTTQFSSETRIPRGCLSLRSGAVDSPDPTAWRRWRVAFACTVTVLIGVSFGARADVLRVGTSGDYAPFSVGGLEPGSTPTGLGPDVARAFAADRGLEVQFVPFRWPDLLADLEASRFDVAMGGITVRPERSIAGIFTVPVATSGAVALVPDRSEVRETAQLDRPDVVIAVNAGGHLERVVRAHFPHATVLAIPDNARVLAALLDRRADAAVTDTGEAPHWLARESGLRVVGPFTRDRKSVLVAADRPDLAADLDAWLLAAEADGTLAGLRARAFGATPAPEATATPLGSLLAALDERLALMPDVAEAKRASGSAIEVPDREAKVIETAVEEVRRRLPQATAGRRTDLDAEREAAVRSLFRAQIEAAKQIQFATLARPPTTRSNPPPDLDARLRPALDRIGDRIVRLVVVLPAGLDLEMIRAATRRELAARDLDAGHLDAIAEAIAAVSRSAPRPTAEMLPSSGRSPAQ
jgi:cyclohexadienyl dehydratase